MTPILHIDETLEPHPDAVALLLAALEADPDALAVGGRVIAPGGATESCGGDWTAKDGVIAFLPFENAEARSCRWLPPTIVAVRQGDPRWLFHREARFRTVPEAIAVRQREALPPSLAELARFYKAHTLVPKDAWTLAPALTGVPAARLLLELTDARGEEWIAGQWAAGGLAPLFKKQRTRPLHWWERRPGK